jgi:predicted AAA+ superfamily ATPase
MPYQIIKNSIFLDEIQNFPLWEKWLKGIYDKRKNIKFVISGSNASLLSKDISSRLTGRHLTTRMFPFSFFEFLKYKNLHFDLKTIAYSDKKIEIIRMFNEYLDHGGFRRSLSIQQRILWNYFNPISMISFIGTLSRDTE